MQTSNFLKKYFNDSKIATYDIGTRTYFTNINLLDLWGLGSYEIVKLIKSNNYNEHTIRKLIKEKDIELIIARKYKGKEINFSDNTHKYIGSWTVHDNTYRFYSKHADFENTLKNFKNFKKELTKDTIVEVNDEFK